MAFLRTATAIVTNPSTHQKGWNRIRTASAGNSINLSEKAAGILGGSFDPKDYLLTHCSIVCSVDTLKPDSNVKLGTVQEEGRSVLRKWADYRINPKHDKYINNNLDAFERKVLMKSYRTFIGAQNFQEHVQKVELSKGRILDAVARNLGDTAYIDILVATHRKHAELISDIESGKMSTLSMGASVASTICTKCGNVAVDETQLCDHIRYEKGNTFLDNQGRAHRIAELCGHVDMEPNGGVRFIEASWVVDPAFKGAVMRNIIELTPSMENQAEEVLSSVPPQWGDQDVLHAASQHHAFGFGQDEDEGADEEPKEEPKEEKDTLQKVTDDLYDDIVGRLKKKVRKEMEGPQKNSPEVSHSTGNGVLREAKVLLAKATYQTGVGMIMRQASSEVDLVDSLARYNAEQGVEVPLELYRAAVRAGAVSKCGSTREWAAEVRRHLNRKPSLVEAKTLVSLASILDQWTDLRCS